MKPTDRTKFPYYAKSFLEFSNSLDMGKEYHMQGPYFEYLRGVAYMNYHADDNEDISKLYARGLEEICEHHLEYYDLLVDMLNSYIKVLSNKPKIFKDPESVYRFSDIVLIMAKFIKEDSFKANEEEEDDEEG